MPFVLKTGIIDLKRNRSTHSFVAFRFLNCFLWCRLCPFVDYFGKTNYDVDKVCSLNIQLLSSFELKNYNRHLVNEKVIKITPKFINYCKNSNFESRVENCENKNKRCQVYGNNIKRVKETKQTHFKM